ncbi:MAG TPA: hypothetical protein VEK31_02330 [Xanthobacteraceae bacterium]|nr:hypothetical protein [Xanthobacteraceae bacterium]
MIAKATSAMSTNSALRMLFPVTRHVLADNLRSIAQRQVFVRMRGDGDVERGPAYCYG